MKQYLLRSLRELVSKNVQQLTDQRYQKFRSMGMFLEETAAS